MKKIKWADIFLSVGLLAACGSTEETETGSQSPEEAYEQEVPGDPLEEDVAAPTGEYDQYGERILGRYTNDQTNEDGYMEVDFEGFKVQIAPAFIEALPQEGEVDMQNAIRVYMKTENTREGDVYYSGAMTVVTDTKEQLSFPSGLAGDNPVIQTYMGKVQEEGASTVVMEKQEETPQKITLILGTPYESVDNTIDTENGELGEEQRIEFELSS